MSEFHDVPNMYDNPKRKIKGSLTFESPNAVSRRIEDLEEMA